MSRKRLRSQTTENAIWLEQQQREHEEATRRAEEQRRRQATPGYRRLTLDEEI